MTAGAVTAGAGTRTILFTDMVGSTALRSRLGDGPADEIRRAHDAPLSEVIGAHSVGYTLAATSGDPIEADRCLAEELRLIDELGQPYWRWAFLIAHGPADALRRGEFDEAERLADEGLKIGLAIRHQPEALGYWGVTIASVRFEQGRLPELIPLIAAAVKVHTSPVQVRQTLALAYAENDDAAGAQRAMDSLTREELAATIDSGINHLIMGARVAAIASRLGDPTWSQYAFDLLEPYAGRIATETIQYWGAVDRYLGLASAVLGDTPAAIAHLEAAIEINRRAEAPTWEARARLDLACVLARRARPGDNERAVILAGEARDAARQFGMAAVEREARALIGER